MSNTKEISDEAIKEKEEKKITGGDFNARIGKEGEMIINGEHTKTSSKNEQGRKLLEMCEEDEISELTYIGGKGGLVIDYVIVNDISIEDIQYMQIGDEVDLDHQPVKASKDITNVNKNATQCNSRCLIIGDSVEAQGTNCFGTPNVNSSQITFTLYNNANVNGVLLTNSNLNQVDPSVRLIVIIHGWLQTGTQGWIIQMKNEYLNIANANIIVVDWSAYSNCLTYFPSANAATPVGLNNVQINAFALGVHVGGSAGQEVQVSSGGNKVARINALDPTSVGFESKPTNERLDSNDATEVYAYYTSTTSFEYSIGTVNVYYNNFEGVCGRKQPGCPLNPGVPSPTVPLLPLAFCDEIRSVVYFIYSISQPSQTLVAVKCTCASFSSKTCTGPTVIVGEYLPSSTPPGDYFLNTRCKTPYGLSSAGTVGGTDYLTYACL
ncbi:hypothetical protein FQR65_LT12560 [Abscondita terminalis]|nr:hypothetical protein FQR65_LT12560 [Abscondita terminalis]